MRIGVPKEVQAGETRVALTPHVLPALIRDGHDVVIESGAGIAAHFPDVMYVAAGGQIVDDVQALYEQSDVIFKVQPPSYHPVTQQHEVAMLRSGALYIGLLEPLAHPEVVQMLACQGVTSYALEYLPRISRAQSMDALTSMATIAGYKAVLLAADHLGKMMPMLMTAAGTVAPANVLVLGAGVAGLQAIATAKRLGARVEAFDPRPAVREQVQSLGASFLAMELSANAETEGGYARAQSEDFLQREREAIATRLPSVDCVICTAQVFGQRAPLLITEQMVSQMHSGAVVVDLAAEQGGNCALTLPEQEIVQDGVTIIGAGKLPALIPTDASRLYAGNAVNLFRYLHPKSQPGPDTDDEIVRGACITRGGEIVNATILAAIQQPATQGAPS